MFPRSPVALREWAVTCDALARGEQIFVLRGDLRARPDEEAADGAAEDGEGPANGPCTGPTPADRASALLHEEFWLWPEWEAQRAADLTGPYRDRKHALDELRRRDGRVRLAFYATVEYVERIGSRERLLALDGEHVLNAAAVEERLAAAGEGGLGLLALRVRRIPEAAVVVEEEARAGPGPWIRLPEPVSTGEAEPVVADRRFLAEKARILRLSESLRAV
ncbi:MAG TPA: DUF1802 family protein [Gemmatimonadota bacterium]|nr:DUF1802 family protein [Gemmatimonadota bacterium]